MIPFWPDHDPQARLDYQFDLNPAIEDQGSPLASYELRISGSDEALQKTDEVQAEGRVYFWLESPTLGGMYTVTCHFELANGYRDDFSFRLRGEHT